MRDQIMSILTNHNQSSLDGLQMIIDKSRESILAELALMVDEGLIKQGQAEWQGDSIIVYRKNKKK